MSSRELSEWEAFSRLEPFGEDRADFRAAMICCTMANAWRGKGDPAFKPQDFMPFLEVDPPEPQDPEDMKRVLQGVAAAMSKKKRT